MSNNVIGINETEINNLITEINDCSNKIKNIFQQINDQISNTKNFYDCKSATTLRNRYYKLDDDYIIVLNNLSSYSRDLLNLKSRYVNNISNVSAQIIKDARNQEEYLDF